jgi:AraC family transcriptional regulator
VGPRPSSGATIDEFVDLMPIKPILSSEGRGWDGVTLHRRLCPPSATETPSMHEFRLPAMREHRLGVHLTGQTFLDVRCEGRRATAWSNGGCISFTPAGTPMIGMAKGKPDAVQLYITPTLVDEVAEEVFDRDGSGLLLVPHIVVFDKIADRFGRLLLAEAEAGGPGGRLAADGLSRALVVHLLRHYSTCTPPAVATPNGAMAAWRLRRVIEYMNSNVAEDVPLSQLAAVSGLGPTQFARAFRAATGDAPHQYLIKLRIARACFLLENTKLPIIQVGLRCGFSQHNHFSTMFRKLMGLNPRAFRATSCT